MMLFAANEGHTDIVEYLLGLKADINEVSRVSSIILTLIARGNCTLTRCIFQQDGGGEDTNQAWG
jgi:ankyrin repeat protein